MTGAQWRACGAVLTAALVWGCPTVVPPQEIIDHQQRFVVPSFFREAVGMGGVAVLPFLNGVGPEGIRTDAAYELAQAYHRAFPHATVITKDDLLRSLRPEGLDKVVVQLVQTYDSTQRLDPVLLLRLRQVITVRYLAYGRLDRFSERDVAGMRRKDVGLYTELWDIKCNQVVWAGSSDRRVSDPLQQAATPMGLVFTEVASDAVAEVGPSIGKKAADLPAC
ncbi:MAG TPA: hypothetical protein VEI24_07675 [Nitrospiria bacterium]|nr:hypothetical protein [Nitrospiria bacterium]